MLVLIAMSHGSLCIPQGLADMVGLMSDVNRNLQAMEDKSAARVQVGEAWLAFHDQVRRLHFMCGAILCPLSPPLAADHDDPCAGTTLVTYTNDVPMHTRCIHAHTIHDTTRVPRHPP